MKLLFINLPYYGHVIPTIGLVQELIRLGCEVTYLMPFDWQKIISESGARVLIEYYQKHLCSRLSLSPNPLQFS